MQIKHPLPPKARETKSPITDIVQFFAHTTDAYLQFEQNISGLISKLPTLLPQQLTYECEQLLDKKAKLEILDQQMLSILDLAGKLISQDMMIQDYRIALARANMASDKLYRKLQDIKIVLQEGDVEFDDEQY
jgi:hypothetical protein